MVVSVSQAAIPKVFLSLNYFIMKFSLWEDTHLYLRLLAQYPYTCLRKNGVIINKHPTSTVVQGLIIVKFFDIIRYLDSINDLEKNFSGLFADLVNKNDFKNYKDAKINMYLYQARVNRQFWVAFRIGWLMLRKKLTLKNIFTFLKLPFHLLISIVRIPR